MIFAIIAIGLPVRASNGKSDCETHGRDKSLHSMDTMSVKIHFRFDDTMVLQDFKENNIGLARLESLIKDANTIDSIAITGLSSPEGWSVYNCSLALRRAESMRNYLHLHYPATRTIPIHLHINQDMVNSLIGHINNDTNVPRRNKVLEVLSDESRSTDTRIANLRLISGSSYDYIKHNIFHQMRTSVSCFVYYKKPSKTSPAKSAEPIEIEKAPAVISDTTNSPIIATENRVDAPISYICKPLFALKTNLLFDAASLLNIELEVPIGKRWSVAGEWIFPWWLSDRKQHSLQVLSGNVEGKYWFGNRETLPNGNKRHVMTGWHAGIYAGGGYYDLEWNKVGYQGEFFIAAGISGGYAHTINKNGNLRMEYSLGIGYMQTNYRQYDAEQDTNGNWHLYRRGNGRYTWIGPTRARISLVWMINSKKKGESTKW